MPISSKDLKGRIQRSRWHRSHEVPNPTNGFNVRYRSKSDTNQLKVTLKGASARSKATVSLPQMPWGSDDLQ